MSDLSETKPGGVGEDIVEEVAMLGVGRQGGMGQIERFYVDNAELLCFEVRFPFQGIFLLVHSSRYVVRYNK